MIRAVLVLLVALLCTGARSTPDEQEVRVAEPAASRLSSTSTGQSLGARSTTGPDTFVLYGGPGTLEGEFELADGTPDWQGWEGMDRTDEINYWQVSTYNAQNLGSHGAGNHAYWCGRTVEQAPYWVTPPGYGSNWNTSIMYESDPVADPSVGQTVNFDFFFNIDSEPGYDVLMVEIEQVGWWQPMHPAWGFDGTNREVGDVFPAPGLHFSDLGLSTFDFFGNDYGGDDGDRIRIRIRFQSDGAIDDQTGLWPTVAGAAQVDDVSITHDGGTFFEDFEGPGPWLLQPVDEPFVGDFSSLFVAVEEIDPYHANHSSVVTFMDHGQDVRNAPDPSGATSTGGSTSPNWNYGINGDYVVNYTGGLTAGPDALKLRNEVWSPWIDWDLPGTDDDAPEIVGAILSFDAYNHISISNGIFFYWAVGPYGSRAVQNPVFLQYSQNGPLWERFDVDVTEYLSPHKNPQVKIALGVGDYASFFGFPGGDATPAPYFDNVRLVKYRLGGLEISSDSSGAVLSSWSHEPYVWPTTPIDLTTPAGRSVLYAPLDGRVDVVAHIYGQSIDDIRLVWALQRNPFFEDAIRAVPATGLDENIVLGPGIWTGERLRSDGFGDGANPRFFWDVLHGTFYPGDRLEYYIRATDTDGRVTTLPADLTGFGDFDGSYHPRFSVRGLPTITDSSGTQPPILVYAGGHRITDVDLIVATLGQLGMVEGTDFDVYLPGLTDGTRSLGLEAKAAMLAGYETILAFGGGGSDYSYQEWSLWLSAGYPYERLGLDELTRGELVDWSDLPGDRNLVVFGSLIGFGLANGTATAPSFLQDELGVQLIADELRPAIGNQASPGVAALGSGFTSGFVVSGSDKEYLALDHVEPVAPAVRGHAFELPGGSQHVSAAASVLKVEAVGPDTKVHLTFPYPFRFIETGVGRTVGPSSRAQLLSEIFDVIQAAAPSGLPTDAPAVHHARMVLSPNPFNPWTTIALTLPRGGPATLKVFDVRGRLVRTLHRGNLDAGPHEFTWDGDDDHGVSSSSGVYVVRARFKGGELSRKALLVK
jgi:hypothetical protein